MHPIELRVAGTNGLKQLSHRGRSKNSSGTPRSDATQIDIAPTPAGSRGSYLPSPLIARTSALSSDKNTELDPPADVREFTPLASTPSPSSLSKERIPGGKLKKRSSFKQSAAMLAAINEVGSPRKQIQRAAANRQQTIHSLRNYSSSFALKDIASESLPEPTQPDPIAQSGLDLNPFRFSFTSGVLSTHQLLLEQLNTHSTENVSEFDDQQCREEILRLLKLSDNCLLRKDVKDQLSMEAIHVFCGAHFSAPMILGIVRKLSIAAMSRVRSPLSSPGIMDEHTVDMAKVTHYQRELDSLNTLMTLVDAELEAIFTKKLRSPQSLGAQVPFNAALSSSVHLPTFDNEQNPALVPIQLSNHPRKKVTILSHLSKNECNTYENIGVGSSSVQPR